MNAGQALVDYLETRSAVTALVGERIYWASSPAQVAHKHLRVSLIDGGRRHNLDYCSPSLQVSVFAKDPAEVEELKEAVLGELKNARFTVSGTYMVSAYQADQMFYDPPWWHAAITIELKYQEGD